MCRMYDRYGCKKRDWPKCADCGAELICTSAMFRCCPNGHGKLEPYVSGTSAAIRREVGAPAKAFAAAVKAYDRWAKRLAGWEPFVGPLADRKTERDELTGPHTNPAEPVAV